MISWIANLLQKRGKIIFSVLLFIIIVAFVFTIGAGPGIVKDERSNFQRDFYGVDLNSGSQVQSLQNATMVSRFLDGLRQFDDSQFEEQMLIRQVRLHLADTLAIPNPTEPQLADYIKTKRAFQNPSGRFEKALFEGFVTSLQSDTQINDAFVTRVIKEDYRLQQLDELMTSPGFIIKEEVLASLARQQTVWSAEVATFNYDSFRPEITITEEELSSYFANQQLAYRIPEERTIRFTEFNASTVQTPVEDPGEEALQRYFLMNRPTFANAEKALQPEQEEDADPLPALSPLEVFEKLRDQVYNAYAQQQRNRMAVELANDFIATLFDNNIAYGSIEFQKLMLEHGLRMRDLPPFTEDPATQLVGIVPDELYREAMRLDDSRYFSNVVHHNDETRFYVAFLESTTPARFPPLEEVRALVEEDYREFKRQEAFAERGIALREAIGQAGNDLTATAETHGLTLNAFESFTLAERPQELDFQLLQVLEPLKVGEVSDMITIGNAGHFIKATEKTTPEVSAEDARYTAVSTSLEGYSGYVRYQTILDQLLSLKLETPGQN
jgi:peptidyl-prolyl cis-trans isomerase D